VTAPVLTTERLRLHPWGSDDFPLFADLHRDPEVQRFLEHAGAAWDDAVLQAKFDSFRADYAAHGWCKFKVLDASGAFVGRAGFGLFEPTGELELGYSFKRESWGRGYATEVATALLDWIDGAAPVNRVIGFAVVENAASRRVLEKAGMSFRELRDVDGVPHAFYEHRPPA
jgi:ribosomal-protein-alanine N-acetyltransferase